MTTTPGPKYPDIEVQLTGTDGNALAERLRPSRNSYLTRIGRLRVCTSCGLLLHAASFGATAEDHLRSQCRPCGAARARARYAADPERYRAEARHRRAADREHARQQDRRRRHQVYGLAEGAYEELLRQQGGRCAICGTDRPKGPGKRLHIDHDHIAGRIRGLLCSFCNVAIGLANDDPTRLRAMADYLERVL